MQMWKSSLLIFGILALSAVEGLLPLATSANGGIKQVAEGKYMVNLSAAPIAPFIGQKQSMLLGFADIYGNLIEQDISVDLSLRYERIPIFEQKNLVADNGVLPFEYTYDKPGLYELLVAFRMPDEPDHTYMPEDFMIDVKARQSSAPRSFPFLPVAGAGFAGLLLGFVLGKRF